MKNKEISESFKRILSDQNLNIYDKIEPCDAYFLYRLLFRRNPNINEIKEIINLDIPYNLFKDKLVSSNEFKSITDFLPSNHYFIAVLEDFNFIFNTSDKEIGAKVAISDYEKDAVPLYDKIIKDGMNCVDIGAHSGYYTLTMANKINNSGKIYSIEPNPDTFTMLNKNVELNNYGGKVETYNIGISDKEGELFFKEINNMYIVSSNESVNLNKVKVSCLDKLLQNVKVDFIKIDIEGYEPYALKGMTNIINNFHPVIHTEINEYWLNNNSDMSSNDYLQQLISFGYVSYNISDIFNDIFKPLDIIEAEILDNRNVLCIHKSMNIFKLLNLDNK